MIRFFLLLVVKKSLVSISITLGLYATHFQKEMMYILEFE